MEKIEVAMAARGLVPADDGTEASSLVHVTLYNRPAYYSWIEDPFWNYASYWCPSPYGYPFSSFGYNNSLCYNDGYASYCPPAYPIKPPVIPCDPKKLPPGVACDPKHVPPGTTYSPPRICLPHRPSPREYAAAQPVNHSRSSYVNPTSRVGSTTGTGTVVNRSQTTYASATATHTASNETYRTYAQPASTRFSGDSGHRSYAAMPNGSNANYTQPTRSNSYTNPSSHSVSSGGSSNFSSHSSGGSNYSSSSSSTTSSASYTSSSGSSSPSSYTPSSGSSSSYSAPASSSGSNVQALR